MLLRSLLVRDLIEPISGEVATLIPPPAEARIAVNIPGYGSSESVVVSNAVF